jgi:hypothetical protein
MITMIGISWSLRHGSFNSALLRVAAELMPVDAELKIESIEGIPRGVILCCRARRNFLALFERIFCRFTFSCFKAASQIRDVPVWRRSEMPLIFAAEM